MYKHEGKWRLGGTDIAAILGVNPPKWRQPIDVWLEAQGLAEKEEGPEPARFRLGKAYEEPLAQLWAEDHDHPAMLSPGDEPIPGGKIEKAIQIKTENHHHPYTLISSEIPWLGGTPDRVLPDELAGLEIKTTSPWAAQKWEDEDVPLHYAVQAETYMILIGYEVWHFSVGIGNEGLLAPTLPHSEEMADILVNEVDEWYEKHVVQGIRPEIDSSPAWTEYLKKKHPRVLKEELITGPAELFERWREAKLAVKEVEHQIMALIGDNKGAQLGPARFTWTDVAGSVSWKKIALTLAEKYEVPEDEVKGMVEKVRGKSTRRFNTPKKW